MNPDNDGLGPPGDDDGRPLGPATTEEPSPSSTPQTKTTTQGRRCRAETLAGLRRRRAASERLERLEFCAACTGCADPWLCPVPRVAEVTERWVDAGRAAALHLLDLGYTPLLAGDVLRGLWRHGGDDRQLAQELYELCGDS